MSVSTVSYLVWGALGAITLVLWWLSAVGLSAVRPGAVARPGQVVERLATNPVLRVVLVLGYMWLAWHLFAR